MANGPPSPDIVTPPGAKGPEGPAPGGQEQSPLKVVPSAEETARIAAAAAEAKRAKETAKREGPGEALKEVAAGDLPVERIVSNAEVKAITEQLENPNLTPAQRQHWETQLTNTQQNAGQVAAMQGELSQLSGNLGAVIAQKESAAAAEEPTIEPEAEKPATETETAKPEKLKTMSLMQGLREAHGRQQAGEPGTQTPAEAATEGGGAGAGEPPAPPETPAPEPTPEEPEGPQAEQPPAEEASGTDQLGRQITQEAAREAAKLERISRMPEPQRERQLNILNNTLDRVMQRQALTLDQNEIDALDILAERTRNEINLIESAEPPTDGTGARRTTRVTAEQLAEADRKLKANLQDLTNLARKSADELGAEHDSEQAKLEALHRMESGPLTTAEEATVKAQIRDSEARVEAINKLKTQKAPEEEKKAEEKADEEAKTVAEESKKLRRESASVTDLQEEEGVFKKQVKDLGDEINKTTDKVKQRELVKKLVDARTDLKNTQDALKAAEKRAREAEGLGQKRNEQTVRVMTQAEFDQLDSSEKVKYLIEVANAVNRPESISDIKTKLDNGANLTFKEAGQLIREVSDSLFEKGKSAESMELLHQALNSQPEIGRAILDRITQREDVKKAVDEMYPGMGKKIWDFARKYPGWLMILLAAIAAGTAVVTVGAGPILGGGAAAAGLGGGAFGLNKKNRW